MNESGEMKLFWVGGMRCNFIREGVEIFQRREIFDKGEMEWEW